MAQPESDRRAVVQVNKKIQNTLSPSFFKCLGVIDVSFLNANEDEHDVAGLYKFGEQLRNLAIHNVSRDMLPRHELDKLKEVFSRYYEKKEDQQLDSLVFSTKSTLCAAENRWARDDSPNSFRILENILTDGRLPGAVVFPAAYDPSRDSPSVMPFGAIMNTSGSEYKKQHQEDDEVEHPAASPLQHHTTFYLRPGTCNDPVIPIFDVHGSGVHHLSLFGSARNHWRHRNRRDVQKWLQNDHFDSLTSLSFYAYELRHIVDCSLPTSVERLTFVDNTRQHPDDHRSPEDVMTRLIMSKKKQQPGTKPVLKHLEHRQTVNWSNGSCTIAGEVLANLIQQTSDMEVQIIQQDRTWNGRLADLATPTLQYACHRHGNLDRPAEDIKSFIKIARQLKGFGTNFSHINYTQLQSMDTFEREADSFAASLAWAKDLTTLLLCTPSIDGDFNKTARRNVRTALASLTSKLATHGVKISTIFIMYRDILCSPNRRPNRRPTYRFRIWQKTNDRGKSISVAGNPTNDISEFSQKEIEELVKLGGDLLVTYNDHERHGLGPLFLGEAETSACQQKRDERLARDKKKRMELGEVKARKRHYTSSDADEKDGVNGLEAEDGAGNKKVKRASILADDVSP
ncbi:hypothetical protein P171DRAFT_448917 [Karstenula rhodostoma CBS 690.94]|uniref:Uncharacterized protein n=1 Tax=Karstenula rhodostoma CBS 690.94 TaxID=1392251 RepID=A0A9P4P5P9_9PLEO|nr:hypothetical protein P171DRAFT_448917 [Karstenula rhodostoma CBS 690.94]